MTGIIVDLFAGGGGASLGIEMGLGRPVTVGINHDPVAVAMHRANHPDTEHWCQDVWQVSPTWATRGRPVDLLWASPDCTHFSKAKGSAPTRCAKRRDLAWVIEKWAREVRPSVICMENVEEFVTWGPLDNSGKIISVQSGVTFRAFVNSLRRLGYSVQWREFRACDYGAPTIRKRLFLVARRDGRVTWPEPTHGPGRQQPYRTAGECIDWSIPCPSIFERKRPLAENTLRRIAEGVRRYVIEAAEPFIVTYYGQKKPGDFRGNGIDGLFGTQTTENRHALVVPSIMTNTTGHAPSSLDDPLATVTTGGHHALVSAFLAKHYTGVVGQELTQPIGTVTTVDHHSLVAAHLQRDFSRSVGHATSSPCGTITAGGGGKTALVASHLLKLRGTCRHGQALDDPMPTVTAGGQHLAEVRSFLVKYFGTANGQSLHDPSGTLTTRDRMGLVTVMVRGEPYVIADIGLRMMQPRELFRAQGFPDSYEIDIQINGKKITKSEQVRLVGNSVCPDMASAIVRVNADGIRAHKTWASTQLGAMIA